MDKLREIDVTLTKQNVTRWNSTYLMLKSFLSLDKKEYDTIVHEMELKLKKKANADMRITSIEREKLKELETILHEMYVFTNAIQSDGVTISKMLPIKRTIEQQLGKKVLKHLNELKNRLINEVKTSCKYCEEDHTFGIASLLDPNYGLKWCDKNERVLWRNRLENLLHNYKSSCSDSSHYSRASPDKNHCIEYKDDDDDDDNGGSEQMRSIKAFLKLTKQERKKNNDNAIDVLAFWKANVLFIPDLASVAKKILGIPTASSNVEKAFSKTGYIFVESSSSKFQCESRN